MKKKRDDRPTLFATVFPCKLIGEERFLRSQKHLAASGGLQAWAGPRRCKIVISLVSISLGLADRQELRQEDAGGELVVREMKKRKESRQEAAQY